MYFSFRVAALAGALLLCVNSVAAAQSVTLAWDPNPEPEVTGYRLHYGTASGQYSSQVDVGNTTTYAVAGMDLSLDYYFAVQAYTSDGLVSTLSDEVTLPALVPPGTTTISSLTPSVSYPLLAGMPVTWTATGTSRRGAVEYKFMLYSASSGWRVARDFSTVNTFTWTPSLDDLGSHSVQVWARTVGSPASYEAWLATNPFDINAAPVQLTADTDFPSPPGQPVRWQAAVAGTTGTLEYRFLLLNRTTGAWSELRGYSPDHQVTWTPAEVGSHNLQVWARRVGSTAPYELWGGTQTLTISRTALAVTALAANRSMPSLTGTPITWTARTRGGTAGPIEFAFYRFSHATGAWTLAQGYSTSRTFTWTPTWADEGRYQLQVWARSAGSSAPYEAWRGANAIEIRRAPIELSTTSVFPVPPGTPVRWSASVPDTTATFEYQYYVYNRGLGTWALARSYGSSPDFTWTPSAPGTYLLQVWARKVGSAAAYDVWTGTEYLTVESAPARLLSVTPNVTVPAAAGTPITWTAVGSGGTAAPLQYLFYLHTEGSGWTLLRNYGSSNSVTWTPAQPGTYGIQVWVRSAGSTVAYEGWIGSGPFVIQP
jgi:hypothetical protein